MPHQTYAQLIRRRLVGKEGQARQRELRQLLADLPDYRNGPYADLRKWLHGEIARTQVRTKVVHRDALTVRREGAAQIAFVGAPNAGKSSLLQALSDIQIRTGDFAFTTTRPVPATTRIGGVLVQLVGIPGLLAGANDDRGGGRALLGVLRGADGIVWCHPLGQPVEHLAVIRAEVERAGIERPSLVAATKADDATSEVVDALRAALGAMEVVAVSVLDDGSLDDLRAAIWRLTGLVRVHLRGPGGTTGDPVALVPGSTVLDVAATIHGSVAARCRGARLWGPSARFPGQHVGSGHVVADGDHVEILS